MYSLLRPLLFALSPEASHDLTLRVLDLAGRTGLLPKLMPGPVRDPVELMGLRFPNRVGLAAGLDKNATSIPGLRAMGFGFVEVGTVTPLPQPGNPQPRLFRLVEQQAIINRMGFNNDGLESLVARVEAVRSQHSDTTDAAPLGINIGKNKITPADQAVQDYLQGLEAVYTLADYVTLNLSSPNTPGLRDLQFGEQLDTLLQQVSDKRKQLQDTHGSRTPVVVKIAPDMADDDLRSVADRLVQFGFDGIIATNTTIDRSAVGASRYANESGGLSGMPLFERSTSVVSLLAEHLQRAIALIGVGGIHTAQQAVDKISAGADLVQIYSGLIYSGPSLVREAAKEIKTMAIEQVAAK